MKLLTHQSDVMAEVIKTVIIKSPPNVPITNKTWNFYYDVVRTNHQLDTVAWKLKYLTIGA